MSQWAPLVIFAVLFLFTGIVLTDLVCAAREREEEDDE
jgi:hypothetical protein